GATPQTLAGTHAIEAGAQQDEKLMRFARQRVFDSATTVEELLAAVLPEYRDVLREPFGVIVKHAESAISARAQVGRLEAHKQKGTFPPSFGSKSPPIQVNKAFEGTAKFAEAKASAATAHTVYLTATLESALRAKRDEVMHFENSLEHTTLWKGFVEVIDAQTAKIKSKSMVPKFAPNANGQIEFQGFEENPAVIIKHHQMLEDVMVCVQKILTIVENKASILRSKAEKKKQLHQELDVEMQDATSSGTAGPSIAKMVQQAVAAELAKKPKPGQKKGKPAKGSSSGKKTSSGKAKNNGQQKPYVPTATRKLPRVFKKTPKKNANQGGKKQVGKGKGRQT
ncbi:hypothetical protein BV25DRAFT_1934405, partial [Artomyces pyxidatus]